MKNVQSLHWTSVRKGTFKEVDEVCEFRVDGAADVGGSVFKESSNRHRPQFHSAIVQSPNPLAVEGIHLPVLTFTISQNQPQIFIIL
jgi:hypothetical protein